MGGRAKRATYGHTKKESILSNKLSKNKETPKNLIFEVEVYTKKRESILSNKLSLKNGGDLLSHDATQYHRREWA